MIKILIAGLLALSIGAKAAPTDRHDEQTMVNEVYRIFIKHEPEKDFAYGRMGSLEALYVDVNIDGCLAFVTVTGDVVKEDKVKSMTTEIIGRIMENGIFRDISILDVQFLDHNGLDSWATRDVFGGPVKIRFDEHKGGRRP